MRGMFTALTAELVELQPLGRGLAILCGGVITVLAISALKLTDFAGHCFPLYVTSGFVPESLSGLLSGYRHPLA
jgi:hypothetical protein